MVAFVVITNQKRPFLIINQSDCEKVIHNASSFFVYRSWSRSEKNIVLFVEYCVKKQIESVVDSRLRFVSPQHFAHCDDEYTYIHTYILN